MLLVLEISRPFVWRPRMERFGTLRRLLWGWFAVAIIRNDLNALFAAFVAHGAECARAKASPAEAKLPVISRAAFDAMDRRSAAAQASPAASADEPAPPAPGLACNLFASAAPGAGLLAIDRVGEFVRVTVRSADAEGCVTAALDLSIYEFARLRAALG